jgi:hypothetical protein
MSKLGKIFLWIALLGAIAAVVMGAMLIMKYNDTKADLAHTKDLLAQQKVATKKAEDERDQLAKDKADLQAQLATANSKITDLNTQLTAAQQDDANTKSQLDTANANLKTAQDTLAQIKLIFGDKTPEQYKADKEKADADLAAALSQIKVLQDNLQASQNEVAFMHEAINRSKVGQMPPGISGKVTFVNRTWNFVVLDVGLSQGVVPNGELIVYRGKSFLGKVKVTTAEDDSCVADILPDASGNIQVGDYVLN